MTHYNLALANLVETCFPKSTYLRDKDTFYSECVVCKKMPWAKFSNLRALDHAQEHRDKGEI